MVFYVFKYSHYFTFCLVFFIFTNIIIEITILDKLYFFHFRLGNLIKLLISFYDYFI